MAGKANARLEFKKGCAEIRRNKQHQKEILDEQMEEALNGDSDEEEDDGESDDEGEDGEGEDAEEGGAGDDDVLDDEACLAKLNEGRKSKKKVAESRPAKRHLSAAERRRAKKQKKESGDAASAAANDDDDSSDEEDNQFANMSVEVQNPDEDAAGKN